MFTINCCLMVNMLVPKITDNQSYSIWFLKVYRINKRPTKAAILTKKYFKEKLTQPSFS